MSGYTKKAYLDSGLFKVPYIFPVQNQYNTNYLCSSNVVNWISPQPIVDLTILRRRFSLTFGPALFYIVCETRQMLSEQANPYSANPDLDESEGFRRIQTK